MEIPVFEKKHVFIKIFPGLDNEFNSMKIANMGYRLLKD